MNRIVLIVGALALTLAAAPAAEAKGSTSKSTTHSTKAPAAAAKTVPTTPSHSVRGYTTKNGTYVAPHRQTNPNSTKRDNYSTKGNVNPYTGKAGTKKPN